MRLTEEEQEMRSGKRGEAVRRAITYQIAVGEFFEAESFVPVTNAHLMGDIEVLGDTGLRYLLEVGSLGAKCRIPVTINPRCFDFAMCEQLAQNPIEAEKEHRVIELLRDMDIMQTDTCINYQSVYQPHMGEHVAWGDTGTVIYANSVLGARTNFESGPAALAAGLTGRTPAYGFHLDHHRKGNLIVELPAVLEDSAEWGAVGKIVGEAHQSYYTVPVFVGLKRDPLPDELKHLGAALASYGSMAMFHMVGVTPEAPTVEQACRGGHNELPRMRIEDSDIQRTLSSYDIGDGYCNLVVFSGPQLSLFEIRTLARLFDGRKVKQGSSVFVTTNSQIGSEAAKLGYFDVLKTAGVTILQGVCFYILQDLSQMRLRNNWTNMASNSAKLVNVIGAHKFNTILRRTEECVEIAVSGVVR